MKIKNNSAEILDLVLFKLWKWREERSLKEREEGQNCPKKSDLSASSTCGQRVPHVARELAGPCGTRGPHVVAFGQLAPLAHLARSSTVFGHPNSEFESVFRLRTVTPSRTTKTMKL